MSGSPSPCTRRFSQRNGVNRGGCGGPGCRALPPLPARGVRCLLRIGKETPGEKGAAPEEVEAVIISEPRDCNKRYFRYPLPVAHYRLSATLMFELALLLRNERKSHPSGRRVEWCFFRTWFERPLKSRGCGPPGWVRSVRSPHSFGGIPTPGAAPLLTTYRCHQTASAHHALLFSSLHRAPPPLFQDTSTRPLLPASLAQPLPLTPHLALALCSLTRHPTL
ncbi:hypothetical protein NDU88_003685 [Pleurodeles waltl]|uniref:Uncharacterized protein n=1 Tax=Pleurodeles waltl TaxID=8319 RepID=A0AAV7T7B4_PLEWA|nr:hypothetical protein NDU88_003685 [Pleurodeles waltl]